MSLPVPPLVHGMGLEPVEPDWPPLTNDEVGRLLGRLPATAGASGATIVWHSPRPFSATAIVSVPGDGGPAERLVVKRHHRAVRSEASLSEEHGYVRHLRRRGLPVPPVVHDGTRSAWSEGDFVYEVHEVLDGDDRYREALSWTPFLSAGHAAAAGRALARLHRASGDYAAPGRRPVPLLASCEVLGSSDPIGAVAALAAERPGLGDFLAGADWRQDLERSLVPLHTAWFPSAAALRPLWTHNDWHPSNLLWAGPTAPAPEREEVAGVIDFGLCNLTTACYDLATAIERSAIGWLEPPGGRQVRLDLAGALLEGYCSLRPLEPAELVALPRLLPVVHVEYALSEIDYFHGVVGSDANAHLAYADYLVGHLDWFAQPAGRRLCSFVAEKAAEATGRAGLGR